MKCSVVIPAYNMAQYLGECIASVLCQSFQDFEIIVVDDGSQDNTLEVARSFTDDRIIVIAREKNGGVSVAVNDGYEIAEGDYICPLGADDVLEPWMLEKQSVFLDENANVGAVFGMPLTMNKNGIVYEVNGKFTKPENRSRTEWYQTLLEGNVLMGQTCLFRRSLFDELGYWDENLKSGNDVDWFIRIVKAHDIYVQHIPMARVRMRDDINQLSADSTANRRGFEAEMEYIRRKHEVKQARINYTGSLLIATPFNNSQGHKAYISSILKTARFLEKINVQFDWMEYEIRTTLDRARNVICANFLESKHTDLLLIDSDKSWNPLAIARLLMHEEEIVAGAYPDDDWSVRIKLQDGIPVGKVKPSGPLIEADFVSAGFLRMKRAALERFRDTYIDLRYHDGRCGLAFDYPITAFFDPSLKESGDEAFCRRWKEKGAQLWVEPQIDFEIPVISSAKGNLDKYYRDLKQQETQIQE